MGNDTLLKAMLKTNIFRIHYRIGSTSSKRGWVGGDKNSFMTIFVADGLGFGAAL